jgi:hypothetical protein
MKKRCNVQAFLALLTLLAGVVPTWAQETTEVAKPLPTGQTWVPFGGRKTALSPTGTAPYNFLDVRSRVLELSSLTRATDPNAIRTATPSLPTTFGGLNDGTNRELNVLTLEEAARFNIPVILTQADARYTRKILVKNFVAYKRIEANGQQVRVGAGIRWIMDVATLNANVELSFPVIAAQAQLGVATAKIRIDTPGINNDAINAALNLPTEVNVENYFKMTEGFDTAKNLITQQTPVSPEVIEIFTENTATSEGDFRKALLMSWALFSIAKERTLGEAQDSCPIADDAAKSTIGDIYRERTGIFPNDTTKRPNATQKEQAKALLSGIKLSR